jgi:hypothetical protein
MTLFSVARSVARLVALKVPRARALPTPFRTCNRVNTHERDWWSACCRVTSKPEVPSKVSRPAGVGL